jgi:hypothetical protein
MAKHHTRTTIVVIHRFPEFYIWNIAVPMLFLTSMGAASFLIPADALADKLSVSLTLLLTAAAYKIVVSSSLPQISYLTIFDRYVLSCSFFLVLTVIVNVIDNALVEHMEARYATIGGWLACAWLRGWIALNAHFLRVSFAATLDGTAQGVA